MFSPPSKTAQFPPDLWDSSKTYYLKSITSSLPVQKQMFLHIMQLAHISFRKVPLPFTFSLRTDSYLPPSAVCYPLCFQFPSQILSSEIISLPHSSIPCNFFLPHATFIILCPPESLPAVRLISSSCILIFPSLCCNQGYDLYTVPTLNKWKTITLSLNLLLLRSKQRLHTRYGTGYLQSRVFMKG